MARPTGWTRGRDEPMLGPMAKSDNPRHCAGGRADPACGGRLGAVYHRCSGADRAQAAGALSGSALGGGDRALLSGAASPAGATAGRRGAGGERVGTGAAFRGDVDPQRRPRLRRAGGTAFSRARAPSLCLCGDLRGGHFGRTAARVRRGACGRRGAGGPRCEPRTRWRWAQPPEAG